MNTVLNALGVALPQFKLSREVVTCEEAAFAKGIPLENELKTLIITTGDALYALHLRGDKRASLRRVKAYLGSEQAFMLPPAELRALGILAGEVSPVIDPIWSLPQLISRSVLALPFVSTNAGDRSTYVKFDPHLLLRARDARVGDFELA